MLKLKKKKSHIDSIISLLANVSDFVISKTMTLIFKIHINIRKIILLKKSIIYFNK